MGLQVTDDNERVIRESAQIMLAVKPQIFPTLENAMKQLGPGRIVISIMAGISIARITAMAGPGVAVIRTMPNTPLMAGCGMTAVAPGPACRPGDEALCLKLFSAAGKTARVTEEQIDAVTAVSGSGPAYVFYLAEAMMEAGRELGLSAELADALTRQTILGAARLLDQDAGPDGATPAELRKKVTSPGGTTQAAIEHMESCSVGPHIRQALAKAAARSRELGK